MFFSLSGVMKTYWLTSRDTRMPMEPITTKLPNLPAHQNLPNAEEEVPPLTSGSREAVYTPVTFQDVARKSIANSPVKTANSSVASAKQRGV